MVTGFPPSRHRIHWIASLSHKPQIKAQIDMQFNQQARITWQTLYRICAVRAQCKPAIAHSERGAMFTYGVISDDLPDD